MALAQEEDIKIMLSSAHKNEVNGKNLEIKNKSNKTCGLWPILKDSKCVFYNKKSVYLYEMSNNSCDDRFIFKTDNLFGLKMASEL